MSKILQTGAARIRAEITDGVARVIFDHPSKHNALDRAAWGALPPLFATLAAQEDVRLITLRGAGGKAFVAGADIAEFDTAFVGEAAHDYEAATQAAFDAIALCPIPTLALVEGVCMGGGLGLALACDMRLARDDARFAIPAARLGLAYPPNAVRRLVDMVGMAAAFDILLTAAPFNAAEAYRLGMCRAPQKAARFEETAQELCQRICQNAPLSLRAAKYNILGRDSEHAAHRHAACIDSADYAEGRRAFQEKRQPIFQGK